MWQNISNNSFTNSCLHRLDDYFHHGSSPGSPQIIQSDTIQSDFGANALNKTCSFPINTQFYPGRDIDYINAPRDQERIHNSYKSFLNMDRVMPWMSTIESFNLPNNNQLSSRPHSPPNIMNQSHQFSLNSSSSQNPSLNSTPNANNQYQNPQQQIIQNYSRVDDFKHLDKINLFTERHTQFGLNNVFNTSPVKSDTSTATPSSMRSIINDGFFNNYQDDRKSSIQSYFSSGGSNHHGYGLSIGGGNNNGISCNGNNVAFTSNLGGLSYGIMEHYRSGDVPPLSFSCFDKNRNEAYYTQASNLLKILSPSWILCIDIAAILLTNTDNKMALSNIGPKLSCFARDALRQIKQKKLSRFIKEHSNFFDIRRPSPTHSALYVTLKFPLPNIVQQFLPSIVQLRKYELERTQMNNHFQEMGEFSENDLEHSQNINSTASVLLSEERVNATSKGGNACNLSEDTDNKLECTSVSNKQQLEQNLTQKKNKEENFGVNDQIPSSVKSYQAYECWLCVREFANVLIHQPTHTMELREIGVLMSQKAKIQAKRNSSKKNYKSFLLSYPKLFRIFGKDDNHSIQWIGSSQDFIKLNSIKYHPSQSDDELFNVPTLNQSHLQFLFNLNNSSMSLS
ncbi:uncharacterized protein cubi_03362 [Cryptosporidium ubiquitum]|uniref:Uncharacterized protein n=1 Tax=Cryptosporidium ubiquitum TaxID=857276 RepID=A0A1J4MKL2_9CRYT|nr:uncharacterized protein cubi_03362 [Cryptosporidium ubiquitum]OII73564.1 hypothetical protein cubi_03362 [Cryptosporidium ubiquitum]